MNYVDAWGYISEKGSNLVLKTYETFENKRIAIVQEGANNIKQVQDQWNQKALDDIRKRMKTQTDQETLGMREQLKNLQNQYDSLDKATRESGFGENLKNQIDGLSITIDEANKKALDWAIKMAEALPNQTYSVTAAISQLRQDFEQLTDKIRAAKREMTDLATKHGTLLQGMEAGLKEFGTSLDWSFQVGEKAVLEFGKVLHESTGGVLGDVMTGELKNWKDYFLNTVKSLAKAWANMLNGMLWDFMGFKKATEGKEGVGALFGGLWGKLFPSSTAGTGTIAAPGEWVDLSAVHGGGFPRYHAGGLGRDEILALLLKKEYVLRPQATQSIGKDKLDYMNATGQVPAGKDARSKIDIEIHPEPGFYARVRPSAEEMDLTVATKYRAGGHLYKQIQGHK